MRPMLFRWRGVAIYSYPAMLYIGLVAGVATGNAAAHAAGIDAFRSYVATILLIPAALIGGRLLYVAAHWQVYRENLRRIWDRNDGGGAMYGGIFLTLPLSIPLLAALKVPFGVFWDVTALSILVGMIFTRIGCWLNGCCAGRKWMKWGGMYLPNHLGVWERRIPTQWLEAGFACVLLGAAMIVWRRLPFPGALFLLVVAGYASGRLALESLREPEPGAKGFNKSHAASVVMIIVSLVVLTARWPK